MKRFSLKHDAARRNLETKEEVTAAERALLLVAGQHQATASGTAVTATDRFKSAMGCVLSGRLLGPTAKEDSTEAVAGPRSLATIELATIEKVRALQSGGTKP